MPEGSRYEIFRDLVLYQREPEQGGPFFLARFEATARDWYRYVRAVEPDTRVEPSMSAALLPATGMTLTEARQFARWRFCRLPRFAEWRYAATGRGVYTYPWGETFRSSWVNSAELGLGRPTPVGTFESGRDDGGGYDLLGNVAEWTESIDDWWFAEGSPPPQRLASARVRIELFFVAVMQWMLVPDIFVDSFTVPEFAESEGSEKGNALQAELLLRHLERVRGYEALSCWSLDGVPWPAQMWIQAIDRELPRLVVGGHYRSFVELSAFSSGSETTDGLGIVWQRGENERGDLVGVRLATDPESLLRALRREPVEPTAVEAAELRAFLAEPAHRQVLSQAFDPALSGGPVWRIVREELAP